MASNRARVWQKREEGLQLTTKACKDLAGGRHCACYRRHTYEEGVVLKVLYEQMTGEFFATFIWEHFKRWSKSRWWTFICYGQRPLTDQSGQETRP